MIKYLTIFEKCRTCGKDKLIPALPNAVNPNCYYWLDNPRVYFCDTKCARIYDEKGLEAKN